MQETHKGFSEDWLALFLGLFVFALSLGVMGGVDILGWGVKTNVWMDVGKAISPFSAMGGSLLGILLWVSYTFFPSGH